MTQSCLRFHPASSPSPQVMCWYSYDVLCWSNSWPLEGKSACKRLTDEPDNTWRMEIPRAVWKFGSVGWRKLSQKKLISAEKDGNRRRWRCCRGSLNVKPPDHWLPGWLWHLGCSLMLDWTPPPPYQPGPAHSFFLLNGGSFSGHCQLPGKKSKSNGCYINTTELNKTWTDWIKADISWTVWGEMGRSRNSTHHKKALKGKPNEGKIEWSHREIVVGTATQSDWRR